MLLKQNLDLSLWHFVYLTNFSQMTHISPWSHTLSLSLSLSLSLFLSLLSLSLYAFLKLHRIIGIAY